MADKKRILFIVEAMGGIFAYIVGWINELMAENVEISGWCKNEKVALCI